MRLVDESGARRSRESRGDERFAGSFIRVNYAEVVNRETMNLESEIELDGPCWWWRSGLIRFA